MRTRLIALMALLVAAAAFAPATVAVDATRTESTCEYPFETTDATGETVTLEEAPETVVALQPSDAQLAYEVGAEEKVVGMPVSQYTDYLDAGDRTDITEDDGTTPVAERVVDLEPDVVLAANTTTYYEGLVEQLREAGLTVYVFDSASSLEDVRENVRLTGRLTGECEGASERIDWMDERLAIVEAAVDDEERPLAYFAMGDGYTAGEGTFQHEVLTAAGVENLAATAGIQGWGQISEETVVEEDPEWIVYPNWADDPPVAESVQGTTAYQEENVVAIDDNYVSQPGPRAVLAIENITKTVHPDAYEEARESLATGNETDSPGDETGSPGDETTEPAAVDDSIPGFGAPAAVTAALASVALLSRRR